LGGSLRQSVFGRVVGYVLVKANDHVPAPQGK
jgi:hypothetical protein